MAGLREQKKERTRLALVDAALDLFLTQGYEATTVDEIAAAVDVSQRTFFRYFAEKEDVVLGVMSEHNEMLHRTLAGRPADEPAFASLYEALQEVLGHMGEGDERETERFRRTRRLIENSPALTAGQLRRYHAAERRLTDEVARRQGAEPDDLRPQLLVAFYLSALRIAFEDCARREVFEPAALAGRAIESVSLTHDALAAGWVGNTSAPPPVGNDHTPS
jgi:AcrR family transcriptional regulator